MTDLKVGERSSQALGESVLKRRAPSLSIARSNSCGMMFSPHDLQCRQVALAITMVPPGMFSGGSKRNSPFISTKVDFPHSGHFFAVIFSSFCINDRDGLR